LAVTAIDPNGLVVSEFDEDGKPYIRQQAYIIAAEQAAAVLRAVAQVHTDASGLESDCGCPACLRDLADKIESLAAAAALPEGDETP
jgi:hypothetical protein